MTFKILSGDFVAEYNMVRKEFIEKQKVLDAEFDEKIAAVLKSEKERLNQVTPSPFNPGDTVKSYHNGQVGKVKDCPISLYIKMEEGMSREPQYGPDRYFEIKNRGDESIVTCEGQIRRVRVEATLSELHKDWGVDENWSELYWSDELKLSDVN
jgi:hypothetical protein